MDESFMLGYDYVLLSVHGVKVPVYASLKSHLIVSGSTDSGKSTALLYWLYKLSKHNCKLFIADFKASREFSGITENFAEFENSYNLIKQFYEEFLSTPEGGDGMLKFLLIDEVAGMLTHFSMCKDTKAKADEIRQIMSSILMLGRSRKCFLWLSMQRYTSTIFPASSGGGDNFMVCVGLGRLTVDGRRGLFAGEHFEHENELVFGQGKGIVLIDGEPLKGLVIPRVSKQKLLQLLKR